jgi:two-component system cell cycle sensor histidine kinase/response regulator CckA
MDEDKTKQQLISELKELRERVAQSERHREELKRAEEALRDNEARLHGILDKAPSVIYVKDLQGRYTFVNSHFERLSGHNADRVLGRTDFQLFPGEVAEQSTQNDKRVLAVGSPLETEEIAPVNGEMHTFISVKFPLHDQSGKPNAICGISTDINERKRVEEALRESELQLRQIIDLVPHMIFAKDWDGRYLLVNQAVAEAYGTRASALTGRRQADFHPVETELDSMLRDDREVMTSGQTKLIPEEAYTDATGNVRFLQTVKVPFRTSGNKKRAVLGVAVDITERKRAEEEKEKLQTQLLQAHKLQAIGTLAGGIAHDFNNLLQAVRGYAELLLLPKSEGDDGYKELKEIYSATDRGGALTRQLLTFSRQVESKLEPVDLNRVVDNIGQLLSHTIPKMIRIELRLADNLRHVNADVFQVEQVLMNLALNARDAMPDGGTLRIETSNVVVDEEYRRRRPELTHGGYVLLSVGDTGQGMDECTREKVFDPFFTTKEVGKGTGLGLAMAYGIVRNHGGVIACSSNPGLGTTFEIFFPAVELVEKKEDSLSGVKPANGGIESILLVDDDESLRELGMEILEAQGYYVASAPDGESAVKVYQERNGRFDLVVLDLVMPGMGGARCLEKLLEMNPEAKIVIASGYPVGCETEDVTPHGARAFLQKPYNIQEMLHAVRRVLDE